MACRRARWHSRVFVLAPRSSTGWPTCRTRKIPSTHMSKGQVVSFGPGSTTGQNYTGTHGCVTVPMHVMAQLYAWATPGTAVLIRP